jgi:hypothetical protein
VVAIPTIFFIMPLLIMQSLRWDAKKENPATCESFRKKEMGVCGLWAFKKGGQAVTDNRDMAKGPQDER